MSQGSYLSPYSASRRWLRGNMHMHSCCGPYVDLNESGPSYAKLGYDFLAITDHDKVPASPVWERWQAEAGVVLIPAVERSVPEHVLTIGVLQLPEITLGDYAASARQLRDSGAFVVAAHPQQYPKEWQRLQEATPYLHGIEIYNALRAKRGTNEADNLRLWDTWLTQGQRLWAVANDDYHRHDIGPGNAWTCVQRNDDAPPLTWPWLVDRLKAGAFYASNGPAFEALVWDGQTLAVTASSDTETFRVIGPGGVTLTEQTGPALRYAPPTGLAYFRVEAHAGSKRAWSQPYFAA